MIEDLHDLVSIWQNMNSVDVGSDLSVGSGLSKLSFLPIIAGGCGGIFSRSATAPLERYLFLMYSIIMYIFCIFCTIQGQNTGADR